MDSTTTVALVTAAINLLAALITAGRVAKPDQERPDENLSQAE